MKTATVTWFHYDNIGTVLQAYALQKFLKDSGIENDIIDYRPDHKRKPELNVKGFFKKAIDSVRRLPERLVSRAFLTEYEQRSRLFNKFRDEMLTLSVECKNGDDFELIDKRYEKFICGSDQIWTPALFDKVFFLDFVKGKNRKISYAPSLGRNFIDEDVKQGLKKCIEDIGHLSVREKTGYELIRELTGRKSDIVLDPTLLLEGEKWGEIALPMKTNEKFILCYFLGDNKFPFKFIQEFNRHNDYNVVLICQKISDMRKPGTKVFAAGPREFLGYINTADYVFTDSFHGIIFSILFNKNFLAFLRFADSDLRSQNSRIYNILEKFSLRDRLIPNVNLKNIDIEKFKRAIDFKNVMKILEIEREKSITFLLGALMDKK